MKPKQRTSKGAYYVGPCETLLAGDLNKRLCGKVDLILTSPPFPLNEKKRYGNLKGEKYKNWLADLAPLFSSMLTEKGSIVIEVGNAWEPLRPVQSLLPLQSLMAFVSQPKANLRLCQQFVCYNPSRLPSPAAWVTIKRIRLTDSYTNVWWMAKDDEPYADNSKVLRPYSKSMKELLRRQSYNDGRRPSQHYIGKTSFLQRHKGSIAHNLFEMEAIDPERQPRLPNAFSISNTTSNDFFSRECNKRGMVPHPARMPSALAAFFIEFLTRPGDLVLDPFAGSNTTGYMAEKLGRRWIAIDKEAGYVAQSRIRLRDPALRTGRGARRRK